MCLSLCLSLWRYFLHIAADWNYIREILIVVLQIHEVGNVEESIALQADVNEG
jgi:hypothetical protein